MNMKLSKWEKVKSWLLPEDRVIRYAEFAEAIDSALDAVTALRNELIEIEKRIDAEVEQIYAEVEQMGTALTDIVEAQAKEISDRIDAVDTSNNTVRRRLTIAEDDIDKLEKQERQRWVNNGTNNT